MLLRKNIMQMQFRASVISKQFLMMPLLALPEGHPRWSLPRGIISPHAGGQSDRARDRLFLLAQENLRRYVAGEAMLSVVDVERGY